MLQRTKPLIFPKSLSAKLLNAECFIEIAGRKILGMLANCKMSTNEYLKVASTFEVFIKGLFKGASTHKTFSVTS